MAQHENLGQSVLRTHLMTDVDYHSLLPLVLTPTSNKALGIPRLWQMRCEQWHFNSVVRFLKQTDKPLVTVRFTFGSDLQEAVNGNWHLTRWDVWTDCGFVFTTVQTSGGDIGRRHQCVTITITTLSSHLPSNMSWNSWTHTSSHAFFSYLSCTTICKTKTNYTMYCIRNWQKAYVHVIT